MVEPVDLAQGLRLGLPQHRGETPHHRPNQKTTPGVYTKNLIFPVGFLKIVSFVPSSDLIRLGL